VPLVFGCLWAGLGSDGPGGRDDCGGGGNAGGGSILENVDREGVEELVGEDEGCGGFFCIALVRCVAKRVGTWR
jgi:hypothetical protein